MNEATGDNRKSERLNESSRLIRDLDSVMSNMIAAAATREAAIALLNVLPERDWEGWADASQARQIEDAVERVARAIGAVKDEEGRYSIEGPK